jgi:serine/threonine protein kinase
MGDTAAGRWGWERRRRQDVPRDDDGKGFKSNENPMRRIARAMGFHRLLNGTRRSSEEGRDSSMAAIRQRQATTTERLVRPADPLGDQAAARYCHFRNYVEALDDERLNHTLFSLLLSAEGLRDELRAYEEETSALVRLAHTGHFVRQLKRLHGALDAANASYAVEEPKDLTEWRTALATERSERLERYNSLLAELGRDFVDSGSSGNVNDGDTKTNNPALLTELESETQREEVMVLLKYALDKYGDELTPEETRTVTEAFKLVAEIFGMVVMTLPPWFSPMFEFGSTFGLSRWGNDLLTLDHTDQSRFIKDVSIWASLNHPHMAKFLGACHVGSRWFIALEKLRSLREYAVEASHRKFVWRRLYEVALSLQYLHERGLACARLGMDSVFCAQLEDKAVLRGVDLIPLRDGLFVPRQPQLVARNMYDLGLVILNSLLALNESKQQISGPVRRRSKLSSPESDHYQMIPRQCPAHILEAEWQILERLRSFNVDSPSARLQIIHDMRELGEFDQHHWLEMKGLDIALDRSSGDVNIGRVKVPRHDKSIAAILSECSEMSVSDLLSHRVNQRLADVYSQLQEAARSQHRAITSSLKEPIEHFVILLARLFDFLRSRMGGANSSAASWMSLSYSQAPGVVHTRRKDPATIFSLHIGIDRLLKQHELDNSHRVHAWQPQWERVCNSLQSVSLSTLLRLPTASADGIIARQLVNAANDEDTQALVAFELGQYVSAVAAQHLDDAVPNSHIPRVKLPRWFVPPSEIDIQLDVELGHGSFGAVYFGRWFDTPVVVKRVFIDPETKELVRKQFRHEADVWFRLNHINVVKMYGACQVGDPIFVCEFASGGNLDAYLRRKRRNAYLIWYSLLNAALGLQYLHDNGVVHGDLKANNILVGADDVVKLADFGLSVSARDGGSVSERGALGAYRWKAPECLEGESATFASDVFSFAMVIIEIVSGSFPWEQMEDSVVKVYAMRGELPRRCFEIGDAEWRLIQAMCCRDPSKRVTIDAVVVHLSSLLERLDINNMVPMLGRNVWTKSVKNHVVSRDGALLGVVSLAKSKNTRLSDLANDHLTAVHMNRHKQLGKLELEALMNIMASGNDAEQVWAVVSMASLSQNQANSAAFAAAGAIGLVVKLLCEGTEAQKTAAAAAIVNLAVNPDNKVAIAAAGATDPLVALLRDGTVSQKDKAVSALRNLAVNCDNMVLIAEAGAVDPLATLLREGTSGQREKAASVLANLALNANNRAVIAAAGAIELLTALLGDGSDGQKEKAAGALRNLTIDPENAVSIAAAEAIDPLVTLVLSGTDRQREQATAALHNFMVSSIKRVSRAVAGAIARLVVLIHNGTDNQKERAAAALTILTVSSSNTVSIGAVVNPLVNLLRDGTDGQKEQAARALAILAGDSGNIATIVSTGAIALLAALLHNGTSVQREFATSALANLAVNSDIKRQIAAVDTIDPLVSLLSNGTIGQKETAARALKYIAFGSRKNVQTIVAAGAIVPLVTLLNNGMDDLIEQAAGALANLALNAENAVSIAAAGAIDPLVSLLRYGTNGQKSAAAGALANLAESSSNTLSIAEAGGIEPLVTLLRDGTSIQKRRAAGVLQSLAMNSDTAEAIGATGVINFLVPLLSTGMDRQKEKAAGALRFLAANVNNTALVAEAGAIDPLVALLRNGTDAQKEHAAGALAHLTMLSSMKVQIAEAGAIPSLVKLLRDGTSRQKEQAACALASLAWNSENAVSIVAAGAIDPFVELFRMGTDYQKDKAAAALRILAVNPVNKIAIDAKVGMESLMAAVARRH